MDAPRYLHQIDLGPVLTREEQMQRIGLTPDSEAVLAVLQYLRDEAAEYELVAHEKAAAGETTAGHQSQGAAQAMRYAVSELFGLLKTPVVEDREGEIDLSKV
jgi:hypothetical protein